MIVYFLMIKTARDAHLETHKSISLEFCFRKDYLMAREISKYY